MRHCPLCPGLLCKNTRNLNNCTLVTFRRSCVTRDFTQSTLLKLKRQGVYLSTVSLERDFVCRVVFEGTNLRKSRGVSCFAFWGSHSVCRRMGQGRMVHHLP